MDIRRLKHDIAYGCFLFWALTVIGLEVFVASYTDSELARGAGAMFLILFPFIIISFIVMLVGVVLSIFLWKHWPLIIIAGSSVLFATAEFMEFGLIGSRKPVSWVYGIGVAAMSGAWFLFLRWRPFPPDVKK
jgi:hypothetical protein